MADELNEALHDPINIVVIEWGEVIHDVLPRRRLKISLEYQKNDGRLAVLTYPQSMSHVVKGIK